MFVSFVRVFVKAKNKRQFYREGNSPGRNMGPGQGGSRSEWGWEEGNIKGGHWARAREGPRTISPKKGQESFISDSLIYIMLEHLFIMYFCIPYMLILVEFHFCVSVSLVSVS